MTTQAPRLRAVCRLSYRIGVIVFDFGLGSFIEKFEEHYGQRATKALVGLVGATAALACFSFIWGLISPLIWWGTETVAGSSALWMLGKFLGLVSSGLILIAGGASFAMLMDAKRMLKGTEGIYSDAADLLDETAAISDDSSKMLIQIRDLLCGIETDKDEIDIHSTDMVKGIKGTRDNAAKMREGAKKLRSAISGKEQR